MMINKAVLHIFDFNSYMCVLSTRELDFGSPAAGEFLERHISKAFTDPDGKEGKFKSSSDFLELLEGYKSGASDFLSFSAAVADFLYHQLSHGEKKDPNDFLVTEFYDGDVKYLGMFLFVNKTAFTHQVFNDEEGIHNEIIRHKAILPGSSAKADAYALICLEDNSINLFDKRRVIDGKETYVLRDVVLDCEYGISSKEAVKIVNKVAAQVAEEHGENAAVIVSKAKNFIAENAAEGELFDVEEMGREVFAENEVMQNDFRDKIAESNVPNNVRIDKAYAERSSRSHKIRTDTGIEITFPADYSGNSDFMEFINNPDGTISIELKNINKIINR